MKQKTKLKRNQMTLYDHILTDYMNVDDEDSYNADEVNKRMAFMVDNHAAIKIDATKSTHANDFYINHYTLASRFMVKHNNLLKSMLIPEESINATTDHVFIDDNKDVLKLRKYRLFPGVYFAQLSELSYAVFVVTEHAGSNKYMAGDGSALYLVGPDKMKYYKKYFKFITKTTKKSKDSRAEIVYNKSISEQVSEMRFTTFDKMVFKKKDSLIEYVDHFVENIPRMYECGVTPKLSVLLYGGVGCGKTTCAQAIAKHIGVKSIQCVGSDYFQATMTNDNNDRYNRPSPLHDTICVLDDIDCVCNSRDDDDSLENKAIMKQLLAFLDSPPTFYFKAKDDIYYPISIVIASTNYYDKLDPAVKRYGRFDLTIKMENFDADDAEKLCQIYGLTLEDIMPDIDKTKKLVISPAQVKALCLAKIDASFKNKDDDTRKEKQYEVRNNDRSVGRSSGVVIRERHDSHKKERQKRKKKTSGQIPVH